METLKSDELWRDRPFPQRSHRDVQWRYMVRKHKRDKDYRRRMRLDAAGGWDVFPDNDISVRVEREYGVDNYTSNEEIVDERMPTYEQLMREEM